MLSFTSTIHDPENRLGYMVEKLGDHLKALFESAIVAYTPQTHPDAVTLLEKKGYMVYKAGDSVISCYQIALSKAIDNDVNTLFYCDLDRALHWIKSYPDELKQILDTPIENDFTMIGRTKRALETHPETQILTEAIGNMVASNVLGFDKIPDILGTTWIMTPQLMKTVLKQKPVNDFGFYSEWPIKLWRSANNPKYKEVEGLEWETPDRYQEEIRTQGLEKWKLNFQTANEWKRRTNMLRDFVDSAICMSLAQ
jgi:hypothetical protein